jgi:hypothetical protein
MYQFKRASPADVDVIRHIFQESILNIPSSYYSASQLLQWAAVSDNIAYWQQLLETQTCMLALHHTTPIGYISLAKNGYINHLYPFICYRIVSTEGLRNCLNTTN